MSGDRTTRLTALKLPTLIIHGSADPLLPLHCGVATAEAIPNSELLVYDDMGHDLPSVYWPEISERIRLLANRT